MMQAVDSKQRKLNITEIVQISGYQQDAEYDLRELMMRIVAELSLPTTEHLVIGNTLFIINKGEGRVGYMRALNADTGANFLESCRVFSEAAYMLGFDTLVTDFDEPSFLQVFRYMARPPRPREQMGYEVAETEGGGYQVTFQLGPEREGEPL